MSGENMITGFDRPQLIVIDEDQGFTNRVSALATPLGVAVKPLAQPSLQQVAELADCAIGMLNISSGTAPLRAFRGALNERSALFAYWNDESEIDIVAAYEAGADDCFASAISDRVLEAKVRRALQRFAVLVHDPAQSVPETPFEPVFVGNELTRFEARLLHALARTPGRLVPKAAIVHEVWGPVHVNPKILYEHVSTLRTKLLNLKWTISNVRGRGYRLERCGETLPATDLGCLSLNTLPS